MTPDDKEKEEILEEARQAEIKKARLRKSKRDWYHRNRHWILEVRAEERALKPKKRKKRKPKKPPTPRLTKEEIEQRRAVRLAAARKIKEEWNDLGWIVAKMNIQAKLTQEQIYELLGGMATKKKISEWCKKGKTMARLKPIR